MSSGPDGWLSLILTTLGAGALGSAITTYGAQGRARRKARSRAMAALERIESARWARPLGQGFAYDREAFAELEVRCMLAGIPRQLVYWYRSLSEAAAGPPTDPGPIMATHRLVGYPGRLISQALWHPHLSRLVRPFQLWWLRRVIARSLTIRQMQWLESVHAGRDLTLLGGVSSWLKEVRKSRGPA